MKWLDKEQDKRRSELERVPLHDPICKTCFVAFWTNPAGIQFTEEDLEEALRREKQVTSASAELRPRNTH